MNEEFDVLIDILRKVRCLPALRVLASPPPAAPPSRQACARARPRRPPPTARRRRALPAAQNNIVALLKKHLARSRFKLSEVVVREVLSREERRIAAEERLHQINTQLKEALESKKTRCQQLEDTLQQDPGFRDFAMDVRRVREQNKVLEAKNSKLENELRACKQKAIGERSEMQAALRDMDRKGPCPPPPPARPRPS